MDNEKMILLSDVSKIYKIGDTVVKALDHANMYVNRGEFVSVIGPSGSGKSTLMNIIGCLDTATSGQYFLDGQEIANYSKNELSGIRNRKIGFIFQDFNLLPKLTAYENVELPLIYQGLPASKRKEQVEEALSQTGLWERRDHKPAELSGGQQQRVAIARALVNHPKILLADEPTGNLDGHNTWEIMKLLDEINKDGTTVLVVTHNMEIVRAMNKRVITIYKGNLVSDQEEANS